ncbi:family 78 glycoside hydrolase catalytic domain [Saccharomonospora sp. NPDC046836]|uniref:family 78 glycoside hydrolase catalytic domain n=1 Tax=Saccharomonospora sp. NPDC046836 TaxID=3156921 RepID=UPI003409F46A
MTQELKPIAVLPGPGGVIILDFGQNIVGRLRLRVHAPAGTRITLRHAEILQGGELAVRPLRNAAATDLFIGSGEPEQWEPAGTFHGFRFAEISGWPGELRPGDVVAHVLGTDLRRIGGFHTSHPLLQRLHDNVVWGARGNFLSVPTDCPQRDERLGWTGDVQVFAPAAAFLFDCDAFLRSWLRDVRTEQNAADGVVPMVVPAVIPQVPGLFEPIAGWGDAITLVPWVLRDAFVDDEVLSENLDAMIAWVEAVRHRTGGAPLWEDGRQFADWLDPGAPPDQPGKAKADPDIVATAYYARSAQLTADAAKLVGRHEEAQRYAALATEIRQAFRDTYITPRGRMMSDAATAYALALAFDLVEDERRGQLGDRLAELVRRHAYRISTGFLGTPVVCDALTATGHADVAGRLLLQTENPSWLYPVTMGATTIWERWDSLLEDGALNPGQMTSFNHFALGAVADWMHRALGGLSRRAPGFRRALFAPVPIDRVDDAAVWHDSPYGRIAASWRRTRGRLEATLSVPPGVEIEVRLPDVREVVGAGTHSWVVPLPSPPSALPVPSLDGPMTDVLASREAYAAVISELEAWDPDRGAALRRSLVWTEGRTLRDPLDKVPVEVMDRIARRLANLPSAN